MGAEGGRGGESGASSPSPVSTPSSLQLRLSLNPYRRQHFPGPTCRFFLWALPSSWPTSTLLSPGRALVCFLSFFETESENGKAVRELRRPGWPRASCLSGAGNKGVSHHNSPYIFLHPESSFSFPSRSISPLSISSKSYFCIIFSLGLPLSGHTPILLYPGPAPPWPTLLPPGSALPFRPK